jgi:hypothetical protein
VARNSMTFTWVVPPGTMAAELDRMLERLLVAIKAVADYICAKMQNEARANARWQDRTGNARSGLFAVAEIAARDIVDLYLSHGHSVFYGKYLELNYGQKYAIIMPTVLANLPELEKMLRELLR